MTVQRVLAVDLGGVLLSDGTQSGFGKLAPLGISPESAEDLWHHELKLPAELGEISSDEVFSRLAALSGAAPEMVADVILDEFQPIEYGVRAVQGAASQGWRVVLATNHLDEWLDVWARRWEWFSLFDRVVCSASLGQRKPDREFYESLTEGEPSEMVFVDDKPENVAGARACGLRGILATGAWASVLEPGRTGEPK